MFTPLICEKTISATPIQTPAGRRAEQFAEAAALIAQLAANLFQFLFRPRPAVDLREHDQRFGVPADGGQPAGAFGKQEQPDHEANDGNALRREHPPPVSAEREQVRCEHGQRQPDDDRQLVDDDQSPPQARGAASAMYIGETVEARPTPMPPTNRQTTKSTRLRAAAQPTAESMNNREETIKVRFRRDCRPSTRPPGGRTDNLRRHAHDRAIPERAERKFRLQKVTAPEMSERS